MVRGKHNVRSLAVLAAFATACLVVPGCGGPETATGTQATDVSPEVRQQISETVSKGYSKDYNAKYARKKVR
ncbi:hypothetical protein [Paludisphaera soli]|uniref:hypothetical protein n=1 Tax=Paludisphaera soli TaxID=2712865 RepID=UPI0013EAA3EA|nr:hypothetical protein [Paludisphaera soli]